MLQAGRFQVRRIVFAPSAGGWRSTACSLVSRIPLVRVEPRAIAAALPWIVAGPRPTAWRDYVGEVALSADGLVTLFHELALTISQFGGFIGYRSDGTLRVWKRDGSGVKAILHVMDAIRRDGVRPGLDICNDVVRRLAPYFLDVPFAAERLAMLAELARPAARACFECILKSARRSDGSFVFHVLHMMQLRTELPLSFGGDGAFSKKASLLLMTMEIALRDLGYRASAYTVPPADYRVPQILEGLGVLILSPALAAQIEGGRVFPGHAPEVHAIRRATVDAVSRIGKALVQRSGQTVSTAELDSRLYLLSRNTALMSGRRMKPHMLVATKAF